MGTFERIRYERPDSRVARVVLARPEKRNAQDKQMLYELDRAFATAAQDDDVHVVILAADGPDFSSGHDLSDATSMSDFEPITGTGGFGLPGQHGDMATEEELYIGLCSRWRNLPKPTIAQVQGRVIAGGLMLVWPMDLVVASEDARFSDPVVAFGINGVEYFVHAWELGARKAKEMLFTGRSFSARECEALGMVNHVVPLDELESFTLDLACRIAERPVFGLKMAKLAVNHSLDAQGLQTAISSAFALHHLSHANARIVHGVSIDPEGAEIIRRGAKADQATGERDR